MAEGPVATRAELAEVADRLESASPEAILTWALATYGQGICLACSFGAEDMVLLDMVARIRPGVDVFYLDTGLLFDETYRLIQRVAETYPGRIIRVEPVVSLERQTAEYGPALWSRDPDRCCALRKVEPLQRFLQGYRAWITGLRRQQSPTRAGIRPVEWDQRFGLVKVNPLFRWTRDEVWGYIREHGVPYNPLHDRGYPSIGCWPCTTAVAPGEDERAGRWRGHQKTECGLHGARGG